MQFCRCEGRNRICSNNSCNSGIPAARPWPPSKLLLQLSAPLFACPLARRIASFGLAYSTSLAHQVFLHHGLAPVQLHLLDLLPALLAAQGETNGRFLLSFGMEYSHPAHLIFFSSFLSFFLAALLPASACLDSSSALAFLILFSFSNCFLLTGILSPLCTSGGSLLASSRLKKMPVWLSQA